MPGRFVCAALCLALAIGASPADDEKAAKKGHTVEGSITKVDPSAYEVHVTRPKDNKASDTHMFKVEKATRFVFYSSSGKKEVTGRDAFKEKALKEGAKVAVDVDAKGTVKEVRVGAPAKKGR